MTGPAAPHGGDDEDAAPHDGGARGDEVPGDESRGEDDGLFAFGAPDEGDDERVTGRRGRRAVVAVLVGLGVVAAGVVTAAVTVVRPYFVPADFDGKGTGTVVVEVPAGMSAGEIGDVLERAGVVASRRAFTRVVDERGKAGTLRPGSYRLRKEMAAAAALDLMLESRSRVRKRVTLPEGLRASETVARLAKGSGLPLAELAALTAAPAALGLPPYADGVAEGFLFPATYDVEPKTTPRDLMRALVRRFERAAASMGLEAGAARVRLTPRQVVVVASIVQAEGGSEADYPKIARVVYNRLASGAKLEMDSTVMYGLGKHGIVASHAEIKRDTPYNTYLHRGLPPGPIANPGEAALRAALYPAKGDWYWFVTVDPERRITKFTDKESEFVKLREELHSRLGRH